MKKLYFGYMPLLCLALSACNGNSDSGQISTPAGVGRVATLPAASPTPTPPQTPCAEPKGDAATLFAMIANASVTAPEFSTFINTHSVDIASVNDQCLTIAQVTVQSERVDFFIALYEHYLPDPNAFIGNYGGSQSIYDSVLSNGNALMYAALENEAKLHHQNLSLPEPGYPDMPGLFEAAYYGNLEVVQAMIKEGAEVNQQYAGQESTWTTALMVAVQTDGNTGVVDALLKAKADPNALTAPVAGNPTETSILMLATRSPHNQQVVHDLLAAGANAKWKDANGSSTLFGVTDPQMVAMLIKAGADVNYAPGDPKLHGQQTALQILVIGERPETSVNSVASARELIAAGASVFLATPMTQVQSVAMAAVLVAAGASVNQNDSFQTALMTASEADNLDLVNYLIAQGADVNATGFNGESAIHQDGPIDAKLLAVLIAAGANVNLQDGNGMTALMRGAVQDPVASISELIQAGANPNLADSDGRTALMYAGERLDSVKLLILAGENVNATMPDGTTVLIQDADSLGGDNVLEALIAAGANVNTAAQDGTTALLKATGVKGNVSSTKILLKAGADVNHADKTGTTALINASFLCRDVIQVTTLLAAHANVNAADTNGMTALMDSVTPEIVIDSNGDETDVYHPEIVKALLQGGADKSLKNSSGQTALDVAKANYAPDDIIHLLGG